MRRFLGWLFTVSGLLLVSAQAAWAQAPDYTAIWRVASRLGYAPNAALVQTIQTYPGGARAWALNEINRAFEASQNPPEIPADLSALAQTLPVVFATAREEKEAQKIARQNKNEKENQKEKENKQDQPAILNFSRDMAKNAALWRLHACANPQAESPLLARMTEFWFNHLNVFVGKGSVRPFVGDYLLSTIRPYALGNFQQLLLSSARHPAMLYYLDQVRSVAAPTKNNPAANKTRGLNENYARELMELHTLGAQGGYTQKDVRELARILTGWTVDPESAQGFRFAAHLHDTGSKVLLGRTFANQGEQEGITAITLLAQHPSTAQRIALRLAQWFVADQAPPALVKKLAASFSASQGDMRAVLRTLVNSEEFWDSKNSLFKTPFDFACSALVAINGTTEMKKLNLVLGYLTGAGQPINAWPTPDGYKTHADTWLAAEALTRRADLAFGLTDANTEVSYLKNFVKPTTWQRISSETPRNRAALLLASPEFMQK